MKRVLTIALVLALVLTAVGCGKKQEPEATLPETTAPTVEAEPELVYATAQINGIPAVLAECSRGDKVDVVGAFDEKHYAVKLETGYGLVEKNLVRMEGEPVFEFWTGYAYRDAAVYDNYRLAGEPAKRLEANAEVKVLEDLGWCCLVEYDGGSGYMREESLASHAVSEDRSTPSAGGEDGGEISMGISGKLNLLSVVTPQYGDVSAKAEVLADKTQIVLGYFDRGDRIPVVKGSEAENMLTISLDGLTAKIEGTYVLMEGESAPEIRLGKTTDIVSLYADRWMQNSPIDRLNSGTQLKILYELEGCCLVEADGTVGYLKTAGVAIEEATEKETEPAKQEEKEAAKPTEATKPAPETKPTEAPSGGKETEPTTVPTTPPTTPTEPSKPATEPPEPVTEPTQPPTTAPTEPPATKPTSPPEWTPPML